MCGIAGYFGKSEIEQKKIAYCRKLMKNRGPDSSNIYTNHKKKKLYLLHSRLSIIDLNSRSNQPFIDGDNILIFNGEIYNYIELKKKIEKKYKFKTKSDTEVILAYYKLYGTKCFDYFDGMWSLAIYNSTKDELVLSRDRFGEKPLYINKTKDGIFFGSEIKYIQALSGKKYDVNLKKVKNFLQFGYKSIFKDNESFFKSILNLNSGTYLLIRKKKYLNRRFWSLQNKKVLKNNINNIIKKFRESFFNTLKLRLRSDVPIAICLSGGIDSATLAGVSKIKFKNNLEAFSIIDNKDNRYNEKTNILKIVKYLKIKHNFLYVANKLDFTRLKRQIKYHDSPVFTITNYLQNFLAEEISRKKFKVVLSGSGADEIFSGYYDHQLMYLYEVRKNKKLFKDHYLSWKKNILPKIRNKYFKDPYLFFKNKNNREYIYDHNEELKRFFFQPLKNNFVEKKYNKSLLKNRMLNETFFENVPIFTHSEDLNFMQYSIENRSPYLSRNLFDKSFETPSKFLMHKGYTKYLLRKISENFIPNEVRLDKQKKGFNASINSLVNLKSKRFMKFINKNSPIYKIVNKKEILREIRKSNNENYFSKFIFSFISVKIFLDLN
tara:strand:+ start:38715 stop:40532 length:1818 start_codon:yes stop_codon:yes gene_type:complete